MTYPSPLLILTLELLSNSMRGRMSGTGSGFMILEYNFNSSHSFEELMFHLKKQKKRFSHLSVQREADQEDRMCYYWL